MQPMPGARWKSPLGPILLIVLKAVGFLGGSVIVGRLLFVPLMRLVRLARSPSVPVVLAVAYCFLMAALAELVGLADIVGAFTAGLVVNDELGRFFGEKKELYRIDASITPVSTIFVPVFFVCMGLRVDLAAFASLEVIAFRRPVEHRGDRKQAGLRAGRLPAGPQPLGRRRRHDSARRGRPHLRQHRPHGPGRRNAASQ